MPKLSQLQITSFRNIESASMAPADSINIILGPNGAGKSSILEAISVLAHGRSFRTSKFRRLINDEKSQFTLFGQLEDSLGSVDVPVGIQRDRSGKTDIKLAGRKVKSSAELALHLPLLVLNTHSFALLEGSPKDRRRFFDWLVFHVKHQFADSWRHLQRCIKQRNSLLRRDKITYSLVEPWDLEIAKAAAHIERARQESFLLLKDHFDEVMAELDFIDDTLSLVYNNGWGSSDESYLVQLRNNFERDCRLGYTSIGPHKAEIRLIRGRVPAVEIYSRGQQKALITALHIAEAKVFKQETGVSPVFLLDDLPSELDIRHQRLLAEWLESLSCQVFVTAVNESQLNETWPDTPEEKKKVFHVKHGTITS